MTKEDKPEYDRYRLFEIRKRSKWGMTTTVEEDEFCDLMRKHYHKEYRELEKEVFEATKPFGAR
jgi:hypothetical protein